jgi:Uri superfamily endonuclease
MPEEKASAGKTMERLSGTYALILRNYSKATIQIGRWGRICVKPGYYSYIGSAFGPGGVRARVSRHLRKEKRKHWHIDYLREFMEPVGIWYTHDRRRLEHIWAQSLSEMGGLMSIHGFGCSDCNCDSHLFHASTKIALDQVFCVDVGEVEFFHRRGVV